MAPRIAFLIPEIEYDIPRRMPVPKKVREIASYFSSFINNSKNLGIKSFYIKYIEPVFKSTVVTFPILESMANLRVDEKYLS